MLCIMQARLTLPLPECVAYVRGVPARRCTWAALHDWQHLAPLDIPYLLPASGNCGWRHCNPGCPWNGTMGFAAEGVGPANAAPSAIPHFAPRASYRLTHGPLQAAIVVS